MDDFKLKRMRALVTNWMKMTDKDKPSDPLSAKLERHRQKKKRSTPFVEPRYDDEYFEAVKYLNSDEFINGEQEYTGPDRILSIDWEQTEEIKTSTEPGQRIIRMQIAFCRENFFNDGAEGETVHAICDYLEKILDGK